LARDLGEPLEAVTMGPNGAAAERILSSYRVSTLHAADDPRLAEYAPAGWAHTIAELAGRVNPEVVIGTASDRGGEGMAHVATRTKLPMAANCTEIAPGDPFTVTRMRWGGSLLEEARLKGTIKLLTIAPHALVAETVTDAGQLVVRPMKPELSAKDLRVQVSGRIEAAAGKVSLAEAPVVVGGGRGTGSAEGF